MVSQKASDTGRPAIQPEHTRQESGAEPGPPHSLQRHAQRSELERLFGPEA